MHLHNCACQFSLQMWHCHMLPNKTARFESAVFHAQKLACFHAVAALAFPVAPMTGHVTCVSACRVWPSLAAFEDAQ